MYRIYMLLNNFDTENVSITRGEGFILRLNFFFANNYMAIN